jgi:hypothetical protein
MQTQHSTGSALCISQEDTSYKSKDDLSTGSQVQVTNRIGRNPRDRHEHVKVQHCTLKQGTLLKLNLFAAKATTASN